MVIGKEVCDKPRRKYGFRQVIKSLVPKGIRSFIWNSTTEWILTNKIVSFFPSHRIRIGMLKRLGASLGSEIAIYGGCEFRNPSTLKIADGSSIGHRCLLDARRGLTIGQNVTLGTEVMIWTLQHDYDDPKFGVKGGSVHIGDFAWLGSRCILLPGVKIGKGAIVAAGAVVSKDVGEFLVVGGVPAKTIAKRKVQELHYVPGIDRLHAV